MKYRYFTQGTCSQAIDLEIDGGVIKQVQFYGGCPGNTLGISKMVVGMSVNEVVAKFSGVQCGGKPTSCPDQLARALLDALAAEKK